MIQNSHKITKSKIKDYNKYDNTLSKNDLTMTMAKHVYLAITIITNAIL